MTSATAGLNLSDSVYERLLRERIIFLGTQVDDDIANKLCAQILLLSAEDPTRDISLYINSPGGSVTAGMAIYDTMQFAECDVATYAHGSGRVDGPVPVVGRHQGQALRAAARADHDAPAVRRHRWHREPTSRSWREQFAHTKREMAELIAEHTGQTVEQITADSDRDRWFTAQQALEYGFVDHVVSRRPAGRRHRQLIARGCHRPAPRPTNSWRSR